MSASGSAADRAALRPDVVLGDTWQVLRPLAIGGMGEVYRARHVRLGNDVAVKVLAVSLAGDSEARARFLREARILSLLSHPHVVRILDFGATGEDVPFLVMELVQGPTLLELMRRRGAMGSAVAVPLVAQIGGALAAAHARGIVHRDLKPNNVMVLQPKGHLLPFAKVLDFGISQTPTATPSRRDGILLGTPEYMAPEQVRGEVVDARADEFALAAIAYALLAGRPPFHSEDPMSVLYQIVHEPPPPLGPALGERSRALDDVLRRGLAKRPADRFADALSFVEALTAAAALPGGDPVQ